MRSTAAASNSSTPETPSDLWASSSAASSSNTSPASPSSRSDESAKFPLPPRLEDAASRHDRRRMRRSSSWASLVPSSTTKEDEGIDLLGKGAADLLQHLESPSRSPPRRVFHAQGGRDDRRSLIAGSAQASRRAAQGAATIATPKTRRRSKRLSFTSTDVAELDIEDLVRQFDDAAAEWALELAVQGWRGERDAAEQTPTQRARAGSANLRWAHPSTRLLSAREPSTGSNLVVPSALEGSPSLWPATAESTRAPLPYAELFPIHQTTSVFPTRKKSMHSLRSTASSTSLSASPTSDPATLFPFLSTTPFMSTNRTPERNRASIASTSSSYSSPSGSTRSSVFSSDDSFRWSVASGSTAGTIPECDEFDAESLNGSCHFSLSRRGSAAPSEHRMSTVVGYEDFLFEVANVLQGPCLATINSSPSSHSKKSCASVLAPHAPGALGRRESSTSIRRSRSTVSLHASPSIPPRTVSLLRKKKQSENDKVWR